jgi:hypothetical protein
MSTITAGDFTVEMDITSDMYQHFLDQYYEPKGKNMDEEDGNDKYSAALYLKKHLASEINRILTNSFIYRTQHGVNAGK